MPPLRAVVYVPPGTSSRYWRDRCLRWCDERGYELVALITDGESGESGWHDAFEMLATGDADVVVVARWAHLNPDRVPRAEAVADAPMGAPRQRRPRPFGGPGSAAAPHAERREGR